MEIEPKYAEKTFKLQTCLSEEGVDAERPLQESAFPLRLGRQLLVEALQLLHALLDVVRRKVSSADL